ncbi:MAG: hypothetical protein GXY83_19190 [Rhodopirellula sp.]|nr:hypothetical protein [Rhodopirellula sp.]
MRPLTTLVSLAAAVWFGLLSISQAASCARPVLLVHGMSWDMDCDDQTWGVCSTSGGDSKTSWNGMIGYLQSRGFRYGGTLRAHQGRIDSPQCLDAGEAAAAPATADLFVLKFSRSANVDGLALKSLELAEAIKQVCRMTGADKVRLVAHSAGGLVARAYLQNALPGVCYAHDVDRLITIATPHLGAGLAEHFGDFLGTRATALSPDGPFLRELNTTLALPTDVDFASIVVRGIAADQRGDADRYREMIDDAFLSRLPVEYRLGGDQVVHVCSQNLRLAPCAARYELATGRPVQYVLARVADPSPRDMSPRETRVHVVAPQDATVERLVFGLLRDDAALWQAAGSDRLESWIEWQARLHAGGALEQYTIQEHPMSEVRNVELQQFAIVGVEGDARHYTFSGKTWSSNRVIPCRRRWMEAAGTMSLAFDRFGRVVVAHANVH